MNQTAAINASAAPAYSPAIVNFTTGGGTPATTDMDAVDPRRYSQFDRTASNTGSATMSFDDFLDMINPLEHIPVVSSVYRAATGDKINPVSHVVGDIMYGGIFGVASAIAGGVGAIADSAMEANTGKGMIGSIYASLFGDDEDTAGHGAAMVASAEQTPPKQTPASAKDAEIIQAIVSTDAGKAAAAAGQGIPFNRNKLPFGGALAPVKDLQAQNMAMAVASATGGIRIGNTVYASRLIHGGGLPPAAPAALAPAAASNAMDQNVVTALPQPQLNATPVPNGALSSPLMSMPSLSSAAPVIASPAPPSVVSPALTSKNDPATVEEATTIPQELRDDALVMRALGLYKNVAAGTK